MGRSRASELTTSEYNPYKDTNKSKFHGHRKLKSTSSASSLNEKIEVIPKANLKIGGKHTQYSDKTDTFK